MDQIGRLWSRGLVDRPGCLGSGIPGLHPACRWGLGGVSVIPGRVSVVPPVQSVWRILPGLVGLLWPYSPVCGIVRGRLVG